MTLIELMVVIVVIGIVAMTLAPVLGGSASAMRLRAAGRNMGDLMDFCYRRAVATGRVHALVLSADGRRYEIVAEEPPRADDATPLGDATSATAATRPTSPDAAAAEALALAAPAPASADDDPTAPPTLVPVAFPGDAQKELPRGVRLGATTTQDATLSDAGGGDLRLLFFPDGTAEFASVTLLNDDGDQCVIKLDGLSGTVTVGRVEPATDEALGATPGASGGGA
jgi:prepilin-type N-terminal cleavage/methylation domain-containing protein